MPEERPPALPGDRALAARGVGCRDRRGLAELEVEDVLDVLPVIRDEAGARPGGGAVAGSVAGDEPVRAPRRDLESVPGAETVFRVELPLTAPGGGGAGR
jgi:hypothetical protein